MGMVHYPQPIPVASLVPANPRFGYPRYDTPGDWNQGVAGNEENVATATTPKVGSEGTGATGIAAIAPANQAAKAAAMVPPRPILDDIGLDYGTYAGQLGRTGVIAPKSAYPDKTSAPSVASVTPATGLAAGGTPVTVLGMGFTGATTVKFGGTNATALVVVDANTITCTSPAHAPGTVDVQVTTPNGVSPVGTAADNFVYT